MRIVELCTDRLPCPPHKGGAIETYVYGISKAMVMQDADVTVAPSYSEGAPLVVPESLACGIPVIATNVGGNPEYLTLTNLSDLVVKLNRYDFSLDLAITIDKALYVKKTMFYFVIPYWYDIAKTYFRLLNIFMR